VVGAGVPGDEACRQNERENEEFEEPMSIQMLGNAVIILLLVAWIGYRQMTWRPVAIARMLRLPLILGVIGVIMMATSTDLKHITAVDVAALLVEVAVSVGIGALMGAIARFRPMSQEAIAAYQNQQIARGKPPVGGPVTLESRTGWVGMLLWLVLIAVRIGIDVIATQAGSVLAASTALILIMVAINRITRVGVMALRVDRMQHSPYAQPIGQSTGQSTGR
jgi:hypothetical protein